MYVCLCRGVTDRQIREAIRSGCASLCELRSQLSVCSDCGKCAGTIEALLAEGAGGAGVGRAVPIQSGGPCAAG